MPKDIDTPCLNVNELNRQGVIHEGYVFEVTWPAFSATANVEVVRDGATLKIRCSPLGLASESDEIPLEHYRTPGAHPHRWFFRCPGCELRAQKLWLHHGRFRCAKCHRLWWTSQNRSAGDRALARALRIRRRLGGPPDPWGDIPPRPKHFRRALYDRLVRELEACTIIVAGEFETLLVRALGIA